MSSGLIFFALSIAQKHKTSCFCYHVSTPKIFYDVQWLIFANFYLETCYDSGTSDALKDLKHDIYLKFKMIMIQGGETWINNFMMNFS